MKTTNVEKRIEEIVEIITENTEFWFPRGEEECCIIEDKEPFFWRINPKWAKEIAEKIITLQDKQ